MTDYDICENPDCSQPVFPEQDLCNNCRDSWGTGWGRFTEDDLEAGDRKFDQSREEGKYDSRL